MYGYTDSTGHYTRTPIGFVIDRLIPEVSHLAGFKYSEKEDDYVLISECMHMWCPNPLGRADEKRTEKDIFITVRYYNFMIALYETQIIHNSPDVTTDILEKTIQIVNKKMYDNTGNPLDFTRILSPLDEGKSTSYTRVIDEYEVRYREMCDRVVASREEIENLKKLKENFGDNFKSF